ncbi:MAG: GNAT family N-acetyltransferase [Alphaproteobacteria bacterium]|nr:GNAT family N-acetyltransferase [Alphaproteobacteria bacterium]
MPGFEPLVLEDDQLRLEPFGERHREPLRAAGSDPDLWRFHGLNQHGATFDRYFDHYLRQTAAGRECAFVITDKASGSVAGSSCYLAISPENRRLEIGSTWYAKPFQGGYVNPAAKRLLIGHVIETLGWNRVEFKLDSRNTRSWAAMKKLGAVEEDIHRNHMILPDGHIRHSVWFSITPEDWPRVKAGLDTRLSVLM